MAQSSYYGFGLLLWKLSKSLSVGTWQGRGGERRVGKRWASVLFCYLGRYPEPELENVWALNLFFYLFG